jgi:hypothetical protein
LTLGLIVLSASAATTPPAEAQERPFWEQEGAASDRRPATSARPRRDDAFRPPERNDGPAGGFGQQAGPDGRPWDGQRNYGQPYDGQGAGSYGGGAGNDPRYGQPAPAPRDYGAAPPPANSGYDDPRYSDPRYVAPRQGDAWRNPDAGGGYARGNDAYRPPGPGSPGYDDRQAGYEQSPSSGYGQPYSPPPEPGYGQQYPQGGEPGYGEPRRGGTYSQNEVVDTGHRFFGSISEGLARAVERIFRSQGRPNGYILGEDAGGAFVAGLRYGEGTLYTKDVGTHRVFWQGPSLGYDFGGEGSKTMVLVYNLRDPSDIYSRFGGVQGAAYVIGGVSVQFQTHEHVTLAVIRSGVGLRLGANVGYLKYTRTPTWNPF